MTYKDLILQARAAGTASESTMWTSIDRVDRLLSQLESSHPDIYWRFMRHAHEDMSGPHYDEQFALYDVSQMCYTDSSGMEHHGARFSPEECEDAFSSRSLPDDVTTWDLYVALNACYADFSKRFSQDEIIDICYLFFFADEDAPSGKIWYYMSSMLKHRQ